MHINGLIIRSNMFDQKNNGPGDARNMYLFSVIFLNNLEQSTQVICGYVLVMDYS